MSSEKKRNNNAPTCMPTTVDATQTAMTVSETKNIAKLLSSSKGKEYLKTLSNTQQRELLHTLAAALAAAPSSGQMQVTQEGLQDQAQKNIQTQHQMHKQITAIAQAQQQALRELGGVKATQKQQDGDIATLQNLIVGALDQITTITQNQQEIMNVVALDTVSQRNLTGIVDGVIGRLGAIELELSSKKSPATSSAAAFGSPQGDAAPGTVAGAAAAPVVADPRNYLAGSGHHEDNESTNVTAAKEAVCRTSKRQRKPPSKFDGYM